MSTSLDTIQSLIDNGKRKQARLQLKSLLQNEPSAQAWYLAALLMDDKTQKIKCLKRAVQVDALHTPANRLLHQLEGAASFTSPEKVETAKAVKSLKLENRQEKYEKIQQDRRQRRNRRIIGLSISMVISLIICTVILSAVGMIPGTVGLLLRATTGITPVYEIDGVPVEDIDNAIIRIAPAVSKSLPTQEYYFVDHGYVVEYTFDTKANGSYRPYVQFFSLSANNLRHNTILLDADGNDISSQCLVQNTSDQYESGIAYSCAATTSGRWSLRIIGINGETIGGYIVGLESLD